MEIQDCAINIDNEKGYIIYYFTGS